LKLRGLACSVAPHKRDVLARVHNQIEVVEQQAFAAMQRYVLKLQHCVSLDQATVLMAPQI